MKFILGAVAGLAVAALCGFGHYEPCVAEASPEPEPVLTQTPIVIPLDFSKELIVDGNVRCYALNPRGSMPAISCVTIP